MTCEVHMICPKCGLIKDNVSFPQSLMRQIEKNKKDYYLLRRVKYFFNAKVLILIFY